MKILITGGAGYVGANLAAALLATERVEKVVVYDNFSRNNFNALSLIHAKHHHKLTISRNELLDGDALFGLVEQADVIVHLAALSRTPFSDDSPHYFDQVNHWGTANLVSQIERCEQKNGEKKRVVFASSGSVYGRTDRAADQNKVPHPATSYASSKLAGENQIQRLDKKHDVAILRFGNIFGIGKATRFDSVINKFFLDAVFKKPLKVEGSGHQMRPFIELAEAVAVLTHFIDNAYLRGTFNINTHNWSVNELATAFKQQFEALEVIHINRNEKLRDLLLEPSGIVRDILPDAGDLKFDNYLTTMLSRFNDAEADL